MESLQSAPLISIGIPTYNGAKKLANSLRSTQLQHGLNLEILVSDNDSQDQTEAVCRAWMENDPRIRYIKQPHNLGLVGNFNFLLTEAKGTYFMWLADDDHIKENALLPLLEFLEANPDYLLASGVIEYWINGVHEFNEEGLSFEQDRAFDRVKAFYNEIINGAIIYGLFRREAIVELRLPDVIANDWHFLGKVAALGKIKQMEHISLHKNVGGVSRNAVSYVKAYNLSKYWALLYYELIIKDTCLMILQDPAFTQNLSLAQRLALCMSAATDISKINLKRYPKRAKSMIRKIVSKNSAKFAPSSKS